jgi:kynurenine formamidase
MLIDLSINLDKSARDMVANMFLKHVHKSTEVSRDTLYTIFAHSGTHFDVMDKTFPLSFTKLPGIVFDTYALKDKETGINDIDLSLVKPGMFVAFSAGYTENPGYTTQTYFEQHPILSNELIDELLFKEISIIGVDFPGIRPIAEHAAMDQYCADHNVFVVENLTNLRQILNGKPYETCTFHTYPINGSDLTGLPCRVVAEI